MATNQHPMFGEITKKNITNAINALDAFLKKKEEENDASGSLLWDEEHDINVVIEPKVSPIKADNFNSIRMYVSFFFEFGANCNISKIQSIGAFISKG